MTETAMRDLWSAPGDGEHLWFLGALVTIKVAGEATDGRCTLIEFLVPKGASPPVHSHPADETFTMIDGALTFVAGDERLLCDAGASWIVPRDVHHTFRVESETATLVAVYTPAGMDQCFRNGGLPAASATLPPPDAPIRPMAEIEAAMAKYGHHNWGPPMGPDD
jgi:quercetin dioxygenase-like cupin family protein